MEAATTQVTPAAAPPPGGVSIPEDKTAAAPAAAPAAAEQKAPAIAAGGVPADPPAAKPYWPDDWRQKAAEHIAAGDKKLYDKELRRLERIADPAGLYGMYRDAESKLTSGGLIRKPGKDAKPEEIAEYHKALGVPEKPEDYFKDLKLENGAVLGEADKPLADAFASALHKSGATPAVMNAAMNWYFAHQEKNAADLDQADDKYKRQSMQELKEEFGPAFQRKINAISAVFARAPGGADAKNEKALFSRLMGGRTADGRVIGDDPDMVRFLVSIAHEFNPAASVVEDGDQTGRTVADEIAKIEQRMKDDRPGYFKDEAMQARYRELLDTRDKVRARQRA